MDFKFSDLVERSINLAKNEVRDLKSYYVTNEFLLFYLFKETQYLLLGKALSASSFNVFTFRYYLDNKNTLIEDPCFDAQKEIEFSPQTLETLIEANKYKDLTGYDSIEAVHLVVALLESDIVVLLLIAVYGNAS